MRAIYNIFSTLLFSFFLMLMFFSCAQQGSGGLTGGDKDSIPPVVLESTPENFSTNFDGQDFEFVFDEYFTLKDINQKLIISPPMDESPEIKVKGKKLLIQFVSPLQADRTYTLNFGDALVDLHESNPLNNFMVVFSTGDEIDSLEIEGRVKDAFTMKPVKDVSVMLYAGQEDSLPLNEIPLYLARTDEEGAFHLKNLAEGDYKLFALLDGNNNYLFDLPTESIAFIESSISGSVVSDQLSDVSIQDSLVSDQVSDVGIQDSVAGAERQSRLAGIGIQDSLYLKMFVESPPNQYITGTERKSEEKVQISFKQSLDSLDLKLMYTENPLEGYMVQWSETNDTVICWISDSLLWSRDSLIFTAGFWGYDSLEQKEWMIDTLNFSFRHGAVKSTEDNILALHGNVNRTMELGKPLFLNTDIPFQSVDTSRISLFRIQDTLEIPESFTINMPEKPIHIPGINQNTDVHMQLGISKAFLQDSSYSLRILPGAFTGFSGSSNDSLTLDFRVNTEDKYGVIIANLENIDEAAILQLLDNKNDVKAERIITESVTEKFSFLKPGKYKLKLILDKNQNGKWDTGRYMKNIQPEPVFLFDKEIDLKANWEMEENWKLNSNKNP